MDYSPVVLPNILSKSTLNHVSQLSPTEDPDDQFFANLKSTSRVLAASDSFRINSEGNDSFHQPNVRYNVCVERRPLSELQVQSPDSHSVYLDKR